MFIEVVSIKVCQKYNQTEEMNHSILKIRKTRLKRIESKIAREVAQSTSKDQNISYTQNTSKTQILL